MFDKRYKVIDINNHPEMQKHSFGLIISLKKDSITGVFLRI